MPNLLALRSDRVNASPNTDRATAPAPRTIRGGPPPARLRPLPLAVALAPLLLSAPFATAGVVTWDVDPANSYVRLTIPDQLVPVPDLGDVTFRIRDAASNSQWTDAGGRQAALDGEIVTDYVDASSISFRGGAHRLYAVEGASLRPNPADWNATTTNYIGASTAPAALGGRIRATLLLTFDVAFFAFRGVSLDITNAAPGAIAIADGTFAADTTRTGIAAALADVDGLELPLGLGQAVPDVAQGHLGPVVEPNTGAGTITLLGGLDRKLTYPINIPELALDLEGTKVTGSVAGLIVAYATLREPPPAPTLSVRQQGESVVLSWPTNATGFSLERATGLPATDWVLAAPPPVVSRDEYVVTNATAGAAAFYRLSEPH